MIIVFFWGQPQYAYVLSILSLILCLTYAENDRNSFHGYDLVITLEGPTCIHQSTNLETSIQ